MPINPLDLAGKTILVTGASSGIGRETAILLSRLDARLAISGRDAGRLQQTLEALEGLEHFEFPFDLAGAEDVAAWVKRVCEKTGPLDGIVHSAGVHAAVPARAFTANRIDAVMKANVSSALLLVRGLCQRGCYRPGASIVLLSSVTAWLGAPALAVYGASKAALIGMTKSLAAELAKDQIRINCVAPGMVRSEMTQRWEESLLPESFEAIRRRHLLDFGTPRDVAHAIAFLLADTGRWITGSTLTVDGGYSAI